MLEPLPCGVFVKLLVSSLGDLAGRRKVILDGIFQIHFVSFKFSGVYSRVCIPKQGKVAAVWWIAESANQQEYSIIFPL